MERDNREMALRQLLDLAAANGYVTFDDIMRCADDHALSIGEFDWLSETAGARNVIIYDEAPKPVEADDDFDDYAQVDYERTFTEVIEICPELEPLISEIRGIMPPQRGEVGRLKYQVKEGNEHAHRRMIEMYLRLAVRIALARAKAYDLDLSETVSDAIIGLIIAVDKYDPDYSGPFVSYASMWIFQNISREQSTQNPHIYFPAHRKEWYYTMYPLIKSRGCLECGKITSCEKVIDMICERINCERDQAKDVVIAVCPCLSWEQTVMSRFGDKQFIYSDDGLIDNVESTLKAKTVQAALEKLKQREREILISRYGLDGKADKTLEQVGQEYGLTRERIRQIEAKALRKVTAYLTGKRYRDAVPKVKKKRK